MNIIIVNVSILNDNITELSETFFAHLTLVSPECESHTILLKWKSKIMTVNTYIYLYVNLLLHFI